MPPTPTSRGIPTGTKMRDGYQSLVTLGSDPTLSLWEKTVKPPAIDGGDPIVTSTMLNSAWHTASHKSLRKLDACTINCAYDPNVIGVIVSKINVNDTITVTFPDGGTLAFFGFLQKFEPAELKEGEFPEAVATFVPTNTDPATGLESGPAWAAGSGTD